MPALSLSCVDLQILSEHAFPLIVKPLEEAAIILEAVASRTLSNHIKRHQFLEYARLIAKNDKNCNWSVYA